VFEKAKASAAEIITSLQRHLRANGAGDDSLCGATVDPELWQHLQGLVEAGDWEEAGDWDKVARETGVFVETMLRKWASVLGSVTGSMNVFKAAMGRAPASWEALKRVR